MIVIAGAILGLILGATRAKLRSGNGKDMTQYAIAYCVLFMVIALFITIFIHRAAV